MLRFSVNPLRLASPVGIKVSTLSFVYLAYIVGSWLTPEAVVADWACTARLLAFLGGIRLLTLGNLGEYVRRLLLANQQRPSFVIARSSSRRTHLLFRRSNGKTPRASLQNRSAAPR